MGGLHLGNGEILRWCVPCEPGYQESTAASTSLSRASFSSQDTCEGWEAGEEREFTVFFVRPQSLLFYPQ